MTKRQLNSRIENSFKGIWIPRNIWLCDELTPIQIHVLMQIDSLDGDFGCVAGNALFAQFFGVCISTISEHIRHLQELGFIECKYAKDNSRVIRCTAKFKAVTAGLVDDIEEYREFQAFKAAKAQNKTYSENTKTYSENTKHSNTYSNSISNNESGVNPRPPFSKENMIIEFKATSDFLECCEQFPLFDEPVFDYVLELVAKDLISRNRRVITSIKFTNWLEIEVNKRARANKTTSRVPTEHDLIQKTQPEDVIGHPNDFETEEKWEDFAAAKHSQGIQVQCGEAEIKEAREKWHFNARNNAMNNINRIGTETQPNQSSVVKNDYSDANSQPLMFEAMQKIETLNQKLASMPI